MYLVHVQSEGIYTYHRAHCTGLIFRAGSLYVEVSSTVATTVPLKARGCASRDHDSLQRHHVARSTLAFDRHVPNRRNTVTVYCPSIYGVSSRFLLVEYAMHIYSLLG